MAPTSTIGATDFEPSGRAIFLTVYWTYNDGRRVPSGILLQVDYSLNMAKMRAGALRYRSVVANRLSAHSELATGTSVQCEPRMT